MNVVERVCRMTASRLTNSSRLWCIGCWRGEASFTAATQTPNDGLQTFTANCGQLNVKHVGQCVVLCGWLQRKRMKTFFIIRDAYGSTQVVVPAKSEMSQSISGVPLESVLRVCGKVVARPDNQVNSAMSSGRIEVEAAEVHVLNRAEKCLPITVSAHKQVKEELRLRYRYLDFRSAEMQNRLRVRSEITTRVREFLVRQHGFVEVETPTLFRKTPGGAQEFVVPTAERGRCYSLVQSPQQFKQLLVIGGVDRYFQIARCYRDEASRSDRQPEFTQVDIEVAFATRDGICTLVESMIASFWNESLGLARPCLPFPRLSYDQCMRLYGTDKPDIRIPWQIMDLTAQFVDDTRHNVIGQTLASHSDPAVLALFIPHTTCIYSESARHADAQQAASLDVPLLDIVPVQHGSVCAASSQLGAELHRCADRHLDQLQGCGFLLLAAGGRRACLELLGRVRVLMAERLEAAGVAVRQSVSRDAAGFLWVLDFPLFERDERTGRLSSVHHPFTRPRHDHKHLLFSSPEQVIGEHFDLVLNGCEVGGGSMRIHEPELQRHVLQHVLQEPVEQLQHMLTALACGAPPHGGMALGLDRLISLACGTSSIRDVIAFPKSADGRDIMSGAPAAISKQDQARYHIDG